MYTFTRLKLPEKPRGRNQSKGYTASCYLSTSRMRPNVSFLLTLCCRVPFPARPPNPLPTPQTRHPLPSQQGAAVVLRAQVPRLLLDVVCEAARHRDARLLARPDSRPPAEPALGRGRPPPPPPGKLGHQTAQLRAQRRHALAVQRQSRRLTGKSC